MYRAQSVMLTFKNKHYQTYIFWLFSKAHLCVKKQTIYMNVYVTHINKNRTWNTTVPIGFISGFL